MTSEPTHLPPTMNESNLTEEQKFIKKFPGKKPGSTDFLRKRIQKGVKYFDSGEYNMAKSTNKTGANPLLGKVIPTPEAVTQRKHSTASKSSLITGDEHVTSPTEEKRLSIQEQLKETDDEKQ
eukprot:gene10142-11176_t